MWLRCHSKASSFNRSEKKLIFCCAVQLLLDAIRSASIATLLPLFHHRSHKKLVLIFSLPESKVRINAEQMGPYLSYLMSLPCRGCAGVEGCAGVDGCVIVPLLPGDCMPGIFAFWFCSLVIFLSLSVISSD